METVNKYIMLIAKLKDIENKINDSSLKQEEDGNFALKDVLYKLSPVNVSVNAQIIQTVADVGSDENGLDSLVDYVRHLHANRNKKQIPYIDKNIEFVADRYLLEYYNKYFKLKDGKIQYTNLEKYNYKVIGEYERKLKASSDNSLPLILMPNGEMYFSTTCHKALCGWINAHSQDLAGAMRVFIAPNTYQFSMTGMWNYGYTENSTKDNRPVLTSKQAETIYKIYGYLKDKWARIDSIYDIVYISTFFDNVLLPQELVDKNLKTLECGFRDGGFRVSAFKKYQYDRLHGFITDPLEFS